MQANLNEPPSPSPEELTEDERQQERDFDWALGNPEVLREFRGKIIAVYRHEVLGSGCDYLEVESNAKTHRSYPTERWKVVMLVIPDASEFPDPWFTPPTTSLM